MPPSLTIHGSRDGSGDQDWFRIDPLDQPATIEVLATGAVTVLGVSDGTTEVPVSITAGGMDSSSTWARCRWACRCTCASCRWRLHRDDALGCACADESVIPAPALAARLSVAMSDTGVSAYRDAGQHLTGTLTVSDTGTTDENVTLDAVTSHYAWAARLDQTSVSVSPGASREVHISVDILPDAWADLPVRIAVRARDASGAQTTAFAESSARPQLTAGRAVPGVVNRRTRSSVGWTWPRWPPAAPGAERRPGPGGAPLYGIERSGGALVAYLQGQPVTLTSDLAGDEPVPVAGVLDRPVDPAGSTTTAPRAFTLQFSTDGTTWATALTGEVSPCRPTSRSCCLRRSRRGSHDWR